MIVDDDLVASPQRAHLELLAAEVRVVNRQRVARSVEQKSKEQVVRRGMRRIGDAEHERGSRRHRGHRTSAVIDQLGLDDFDRTPATDGRGPDGRPHVLLDDVAAGAQRAHVPVEIQRAFAQAGDRLQVVRDEEDRDPLFLELQHPLDAALLKPHVADAEHLVDQEDVGLEVRGDREPETRVHPRRVALHRRVDELRQAGELDDLVELPRDLAALHVQDGALEINVLAAGQVGMESGRDLDERADAPMNLAAPARRRDDPVQQLQRGRFAGAIRSDDPQRFAPLHLERHVADGPELLFGELRRVRAPADQPAGERRHQIAQAVVPLPAPKLLPDALEPDAGLCHGHMFSANVSSPRWNTIQAASRSTAEKQPAATNGAAGGNVPRNSTSR